MDSFVGNFGTFELILEWALRIVMLIYVPQRRSPAAARSWLLFIFLLPLPGVILYMIFGRVYWPHRRIVLQGRIAEMIRQAQAERNLSHHQIQPHLAPHLIPSVALAQRLGDFGILGGNQIEILTDYASSIGRLISDIEAAKHHVHLLYFIYADDETGEGVAAALMRAAQRGVQCRLLLDGVGSKKALRGLARKMRKSGIEVVGLLPFRPFRRQKTRFDLRNHRKLAVIDGQIGYTGSQNIVDIDGTSKLSSEELVVRVTGPVVWQLQVTFLVDNYLEKEKMLPLGGLFPEPITAGRSAPSGPSYLHANIRDLMVALIHGAQQRVVMTTPYFVPDEPFLQALHSATLRGVEVYLVVPRYSNQRFTDLAQRSYYEELLEAGVKIKFYRPHFLHAKHFTIDDSIAVIGSSNIDIRSFLLNAEVSLIVYDADFVAKLREVQERYFANSDSLSLEHWQKRPLWSRVAQNTARLADSLL